MKKHQIQKTNEYIYRIFRFVSTEAAFYMLSKGEYLYKYEAYHRYSPMRFFVYPHFDKCVVQERGRLLGRNK